MFTLSPTLLRLATGLFCLLPAACGSSEPASPGARPNVLLLSIDTLRADHLGYHGYPRPTSPRLDAFAESAIVFENAQSTAPWTLPSLASIFTSTYTSTHGCWTLGSRLDESFETLPEMLTAAGYDSAVVASHRLCAPDFGISQGFVHNDFQLCDMEGVAEQFITSKQISDRGIRFLNQKHAAADGKPWLLWLHYFDPHDEYMWQPEHSADFPPIEGGRKDVDLYDGEIAFTDFHVGRVFDALAANGQDQETVVVLFSDHGEEFKDHGRLGHGLTLHGEMLHVPMALRIPEHGGQRLAQVVSTVDLMPTLLELCGLPLPSGLEGRSLMPLLLGTEKEPRLAFAEAGMRGRKRLESIQEGKFKWIQEHKSGAGQLFDVQADPGEQLDISAEHPELIQRLAAALAELRTAAERKAELFQHSQVALTPEISDELGGLGYTEDPEEEEDSE